MTCVGRKDAWVTCVGTFLKAFQHFTQPTQLTHVFYVYVRACVRAGVQKSFQRCVGCVGEWDVPWPRCARRDLQERGAMPRPPRRGGAPTAEKTAFRKEIEPSESAKTSPDPRVEPTESVGAAPDPRVAAFLPRATSPAAQRGTVGCLRRRFRCFSSRNAGSNASGGHSRKTTALRAFESPRFLNVSAAQCSRSKSRAA